MVQYFVASQLAIVICWLLASYSFVAPFILTVLRGYVPEQSMLFSHDASSFLNTFWYRETSFCYNCSCTLCY